MLVERSEHWYKEHGQKRPKRKELGIITDKKFYMAGNKVVCWPSVFWEGAVHDSLTHPINVTPARKSQRNLPSVDVKEEDML